MDGLSGKGEPDQGVTGKETSQTDNLSQAREEVRNMFNKHVQILTVTNPEAPGLIDRIASKLH
ncbi:hypothetical protein, partial [Streptomyces sp. URMC 124]|uniref:hypothetical protein n=1 Tax=Streptomyces sp. URMC 124 TaxID=3423405 RepID=UPI003F52D34A